jgi:hypothetical protein
MSEALILVVEIGVKVRLWFDALNETPGMQQVLLLLNW